MQRRESTFDARCCKCGANIPVGAEMFYQAAAPRGQRSYCTSCGTSESVVADPAAELAELKRKLASMDQAKPAPVVKPASDPLAAAIAAAIEPLIAGKLDESRVKAIIAEYMKPQEHVIRVTRPELPEGVNVGRQHKQFEQLLLACTARTKDGFRLNVSMTGSAGTGKTTAAHMVSKALGLDFSSTGSLTDTYKIFGFVKPSDGEPVITAFRERWVGGGLFLFDDFDASDPAATVEANHPLANGHYTFPDGKTLPRHQDCILVMTMNTWGHGASDDYVGRVKQDKAFLDRFVQIDWEIDENLEMDLATNKTWAGYVQTVRSKVKRAALKVLVTPRATIYGEALLAAGLPMDLVKAMTLKKGMSEEQWRSVC